MHFEVYAANLRQGGAIVTASSLIDGILELINSGKFHWLGRLDIVVSPQVLNNMSNVSLISLKNGVYLTVREDKPKKPLLRQSTRGVDVRYVIFGPEYLRSRARITVAGFADGTLIQSWQATQGDGNRSRKLSLRERLRAKLKRRFLSKYEAYVVQTDGMAKAISRLYPSKPIAVLPNVLSTPFFKLENRQHFDLPERGLGEFRFFYPAKAYPHKNHQLLVEVSREFQKMFDSRLTFVVTLTVKEYSDVFRNEFKEIINVGTVGASALPSLYAQTDGLFFPSFNETFSAAPIEAALMQRPIIISDRPFARDVLSGFATYFDPTDAVDAALKIYHVISLQESGSTQLNEQLDLAEHWARAHSDPGVISAKLLDFLHFCNSLST